MDVDFNKDGQVDRLTIWPDGRIAYEERNAQGVLVLKEGPESPFDGSWDWRWRAPVRCFSLVVL